jgi:hypothetical protein
MYDNTFLNKTWTDLMETDQTVIIVLHMNVAAFSMLSRYHTCSLGGDIVGTGWIDRGLHTHSICVSTTVNRPSISPHHSSVVIADLLGYSTWHYGLGHWYECTTVIFTVCHSFFFPHFYTLVCSYYLNEWWFLNE